MWLWVGLVDITKAVLEGLKSLATLPTRIMSSQPVKFFKDLSNSENPLSSHKWVNLVWGGGSFVCYWADHFIRLFKNKDYKFETLDYVFIAAMAGISTISAIASKKAQALMGEPDPSGKPSKSPDDCEDSSDSSDTPPNKRH